MKMKERDEKREVLGRVEGDYLLDYAIFTGAVRVYVTRIYFLSSFLGQPRLRRVSTSPMIPCPLARGEGSK